MLVSFFLSSLMVLGSLAIFFRTQPQIPLFYSLARESQHLTSKEWLFLIPGISFIISFLHLLIIKTQRHTDQLLMKLFAWTTAGILVVLGLALLRIIIIIN